MKKSAIVPWLKEITDHEAEELLEKFRRGEIDEIDAHEMLRKTIESIRNMRL